MLEQLTIPPKIKLLGLLLLILFIFSNQQGVTQKTQGGTGISILNTQVDKTGPNSCKYTLVRTNVNFKNQALKVHVHFLSKNGSVADDLNWDDDTLQTENPRLDYLLTGACPDYVQKNGVTSIKYTLSDSLDKIIEEKTIDVSTRFVNP